MTKEERNKICITCNNHNLDDRYGVLCGLTNNFAHFDTTCRDYEKKRSINYKNELSLKTNVIKSKKKSNKGVGALVGSGVALWIIFKILLTIIKSFSE